MYCDSDQIRQRHWATSRPGGHCLVGAVLHLSRKHCLPKPPAIALPQDAMPRPGLPLVHFNDRCCGNVAELRSIILTARRLADDHAEPRDYRDDRNGLGPIISLAFVVLLASWVPGPQARITFAKRSHNYRND